MRTFTLAERRARLARRHFLVPSAPGPDPVAVAGGLTGLHATDPATVYLSLAARVGGLAPADVERALYDDRLLLKILGMRRTMFVCPLDLAGVVVAACIPTISGRGRALTAQLLEAAGIEDAGRWVREAEEETLAALQELGEATAAQLAARVPRLRTRVTLAPGKAYSADANIGTRILFELAAQGRIIRGRPLGTWLSSQYRWSPVERWLPQGLRELGEAEAQTELVARWLRTFGPAPLQDLRWWTGWTAAAVRRALAPLELAEVDLGGATGLALAADLEPESPPEPWAALLPALDPTPMGWSERSWFLGSHQAALFDRSGNIGPSVWWEGRIVGGWAQRRGGEVVVRLLEDPGSDARAAIAARAAELEAWLGERRVTPRFRTPLEKELSA